MSTTYGLPTRPTMPTPESELRSVHQFTRYQILRDDWDDVIKEWIDEHIPADRSAAWGIPDTSVNPLADMSRQLTVPGLYGQQPDARGDTRVLEAAIEAGFWTKNQFVQYMAVGMGDYYYRADIIDGEADLRPVSPHNLHLIARASQPGVARALWELRLRDLRLPGASDPAWSYCWDVYDLGDEDRGLEPVYAIYRATDDRNGSQLGEDVTSIVLGKPAMRGADYPYRLADGKQFLPWSRYTPVDSGELSNHFEKRGAHRGTLNAALYATYTGHAARDCTGAAVITAGLEFPAEVLADTDNNARGVRNLVLTPGAIIEAAFKEDLPAGRQPMVHEVGSGANLEALANFTHEYVLQLAVRWGLNPSDVSRQSANPSSAAALFISNEGKRQFSAQVEEVFRRSDLWTLRIIAALMNRGGMGPVKEGPFSVSYHAIPLSSQERKQRREDLEWQRDQGLISPLDEYMELHPGVSEEDAHAALVKIAVDEALLDQAVKAALAAAGVERPEPPKPPAPAPEPPAPDDDPSTESTTSDDLKET